MKRSIPVLMIITASVMLAGCAGGDNAANYLCGREPAEFADAGDAATLRAAGELFELRRAVSASGAKYAAPDDPETYFWTKDDRALMSIRGKAYPECKAKTSSES